MITATMSFFLVWRFCDDVNAVDLTKSEKKYCVCCTGRSSRGAVQRHLKAGDWLSVDSVQGLSSRWSDPYKQRSPNCRLITPLTLHFIVDKTLPARIGSALAYRRYYACSAISSDQVDVLISRYRNIYELRRSIIFCVLIFLFNVGWALAVNIGLTRFGNIRPKLSSWCYLVDGSRLATRVRSTFWGGHSWSNVSPAPKPSGGIPSCDSANFTLGRDRAILYLVTSFSVIVFFFISWRVYYAVR